MESASRRHKGWVQCSFTQFPNFLFSAQLLTGNLATDFSARLAGINVGAPARPLPSADFGLIGLAVMGQNLILNVADHGFTVCAYNRTTSKVDNFLANEAKGKFRPEPACTLLPADADEMVI